MEEKESFSIQTMLITPLSPVSMLQNNLQIYDGEAEIFILIALNGRISMGVLQARPNVP